MRLPRFAFTGSPVVYGDMLFVDVGRIITLDKISVDMCAVCSKP